MQELSLTNLSSKVGSSASKSSSINYDHSGEDLAAKFSDEAGQLQAARSKTLLDDPLQAMPISSRIGHLQKYLKAYRTGENPDGLAVVPKTRVNSASSSSSANGDNSQSVSFGWPNQQQSSPP